MIFTQEMQTAAEALLSYLDKSPTAVHAVEETARTLRDAGFRELNPSEAWDLKPGEAFFIRRHYSALIAGIAGELSEREHRFRIIGAHTDSPGFRVKSTNYYRDSSYSLLGVEVYGGPLLGSWADRDLGLAGSIFIRGGQGPEHRLWKSGNPWLRISQAAIHLNREVNDKGLVFNKQDEMNPILGSLEEHGVGQQEIYDRIAADLGTDSGDILSVNLELYDLQPAAFGGLHGDMIYSGRIDNLAMCRAATAAMAACASDSSLRNTALAVLYDAEEIGSATLNGGASPLLIHTMERILLSVGRGREDLLRSLPESRIFSADGAHALHPNFKGKYDTRAACLLNRGPAIKVNANQRYASNALTIAETESLCRAADIPWQTYYHRADLPCGSTIGPMNAAATGIPTLDIGNPMLSMHSIRECAGSADQFYMEKLMHAFLNS